MADGHPAMPLRMSQAAPHARLTPASLGVVVVEPRLGGIGFDQRFPVDESAEAEDSSGSCGLRDRLLAVDENRSSWGWQVEIDDDR